MDLSVLWLIQDAREAEPQKYRDTVVRRAVIQRVSFSKEINYKKWEKHQKQWDFLRRKRVFLQGSCSRYQREEASASLARTACGAADLQSRQNSAPC